MDNIYLELHEFRLIWVAVKSPLARAGHIVAASRTDCFYCHRTVVKQAAGTYSAFKKNCSI